MKLIWLWTSFLFSGCCMLECVGHVQPSQPYGAHWIKGGMTKDSRLDDTALCGSGRTEYVTFSDKKIQGAKLADDSNDIKGYLRLRDQWGECMRSKGYIYLEICDSRCQYP